MTKKNSSNNYVNEKAVRLIAALVVLLTLATLLTGWAWLALFLTVDFALRAFTPLASPLSVMAKRSTKAFGLQPKPIFASPKKFAAALGFIFSLGITVFLYLHHPVAANIIGGVLLACALLEAVFNTCLGCYVHNWIVVPIVRRNMAK